MDAAVRVALQELGDRRALPERLQELDLGVGQRDEHRGDAVVGLRHRGRHLGAERRAIDVGGLADIAHRDGDVIETSDHLLLTMRLCPFTPTLSPTGRGSAQGERRPRRYSASTCTWHMGFLPQWTAMAERTAPRTASIS